MTVMNAEMIAAAGGATKIMLPVNNRRIMAVMDSFGATYGYTKDATTTDRRACSGMAWAMALSGGQFQFDYSLMKSVDGQTTRAALNTAYGGLAKVLDDAKAGILVWQPGTNNPQNGFDADATIADDKAAVALALARGMRVVLVGIAPRNGWSDSPDAATIKLRRQQNDRVNASRAQMAREIAGVAYADTQPGLADYTSVIGGILAQGHRGDGLHLSDGWGGFWHGMAIWRALQSFGYVYAPLTRLGNYQDAYDAVANPYGNRLQNPQLYTTVAASGAFTGVVPQNYPTSRANGSSATAVGARVMRDDLTGTAQQWAITVPAAGSVNELMRMERTGITAFAVGETIAASVGLLVKSPIGCRAPTLILSALDSGGVTLASTSCFASTGPMPDLAYQCVLETDGMVIPAGTASLRWRVGFTIDGTVTTNAATVQWTDPRLFTPMPSSVSA